VTSIVRDRFQFKLDALYRSMTLYGSVELPYISETSIHNFNISFNSFRSRFRFIRHLDKKTNHQQAPVTPKIQQQTFKFPLLMDS
jgi:hypothetical protein